MQCPSRAACGSKAGAALLGATLLTVVLILPYQLSLLPLPEPLPVPLPVLVLAALGQSAVLFGALIAAGLWLGAKIGLGFPGLERWLAGERADPGRGRRWGQAAVTGAVGAALLAAVLTVAQRWLPAPRSALPAPAWWQGLLASFYGGITEEVLVRLGLMTVLAFGLSRVWHDGAGRPTAAAMWASVAGAALLFGAGHLPAAGQIYPLTPTVIAYIVAGNAALGLVFGWLYWRRGLGAAMIAHFSADLVLHVVVPLVALALR